MSYFPLKWAKGSLFMQSSMKIKHIFPLNLYKILKIVITCEFDKYSNYTQIIVLSITFARTSTIFPVIREIIPVKMYKNI